MRPVAALALAFLCCAGLAACKRSQPFLRDNAPPPTPVRTGADGAPGYVGRWAAAATACGHAAWLLGPEVLQSPGALRCTVSQVTSTSAGFTVNSACSNGGAQTPGRIVMTMVGQGPSRSMTLSGGPFAEPVSLVRCPAGQP